MAVRIPAELFKEIRQDFHMNSQFSIFNSQFISSLPVMRV